MCSMVLTGTDLIKSKNSNAILFFLIWAMPHISRFTELVISYFQLKEKKTQKKLKLCIYFVMNFNILISAWEWFFILQKNSSAIMYNYLHCLNAFLNTAADTKWVLIYNKTSNSNIQSRAIRLIVWILNHVKNINVNEYHFQL